MSRHHRAQNWSTHSPKLRVIIAAQLPLRCVNCPHPVMPDETWQVGHRKDAALGGKPTAQNAGPAHAYCTACKRRCNQSAGGRLGAAIANSKRQASKDIRAWMVAIRTRAEIIRTGVRFPFEGSIGTPAIGRTNLSLYHFGVEK